MTWKIKRHDNIPKLSQTFWHPIEQAVQAIFPAFFGLLRISTMSASYRALFWKILDWRIHLQEIQDHHDWLIIYSEYRLWKRQIQDIPARIKKCGNTIISCGQFPNPFSTATMWTSAVLVDILCCPLLSFRNLHFDSLEILLLPSVL